MRVTKLLLAAIAVLLFIISYSQEKKPAIISGSVKDARSKAPLTEAVVTLSSDAFEGQKFALTDSTGMYRINNLPAGHYTIAFEMEGYEKFVQESIALKEGMSLGISFQMVKERKGKNKTVKAGKDSVTYEIKNTSSGSM